MQRRDLTSSRRARTGRALAVPALALAALMGVAGCSGAVGSKTGGRADPVVLTLADGVSDPYYEPAIAYFIKRVDQLSGGQVRIKDAEGWGDHAPDYEQQIVHDVAAGKAELGFVGTRVFDTMGVPTFRALTAPMLIDSYPLEKAVIASPIPGQMLPSLAKLHVRGLAVLGDGLRKPIAKKKPLVAPSDWKGVTVGTIRSATGAAAFKALGASTTDDISATFSGGERNLRIWRNNYLTNYPVVTANVNLWPQTLALLANPSRLARLPEQQRGWIERAAKEAAASSTGLFDHDQEILTASCARGARFIDATDEQLKALRKSFDAVYATLEADAETKSFLERIKDLKQRTGAGAALTIPAGCAVGDAPVTTDAVQGVWQTAPVTEGQLVQTFVAAGGTEAAAHELFRENEGATRSVVWRLDFEHGSLEQYESSDGAAFEHGDHRTYRISGSTLTFVEQGCTVDFHLEVDATHLRLKPFHDCGDEDAPYVRTIYGGFDFAKQS